MAGSSVLNTVFSQIGGLMLSLEDTPAPRVCIGDYSYEAGMLEECCNKAGGFEKLFTAEDLDIFLKSYADYTGPDALSSFVFSRGGGAHVKAEYLKIFDVVVNDMPYARDVLEQVGFYDKPAPAVG